MPRKPCPNGGDLEDLVHVIAGYHHAELPDQLCLPHSIRNLVWQL